MPNYSESMLAAMARIDDDFVDTPPSTSMEMNAVPNGKYDVLLANICLDFAKNGSMVAVMEMEIGDGEYDGSGLRKTHWLTDENGGIDQSGTARFKRDMETLGLDTGRMGIRQIGEHLPAFIGSRIGVTVKRVPGKKAGTEYVNIYVNKVLSVSAGQPLPPRAEAGAKIETERIPPPEHPEFVDPFADN